MSIFVTVSSSYFSLNKIPQMLEIYWKNKGIFSFTKLKEKHLKGFSRSFEKKLKKLSKGT